VIRSTAVLRQIYHWSKASYDKTLGFPITRALSNWQTADIAIFHQFHKPPYGGGNQFLLALRQAFAHKGWRVENNRISATTRACLYNSYNFDFARLRFLRRNNCLMVHRVDGPLTVYRGREDGSDQRIWAINQELADVTVFQSHYSWRKHLELGLTFQSPVVISNACDPTIFHANGRNPFSRQRKIRLISSSWSNNPQKGGEIYAWLDAHLDWNQYEYTFVGQSSHSFNRIHHIAPVPSADLADLLRQHDIYITASRHDACSNAVLEALACGLPVVYLNSGGTPELVQRGGLPFDQAAEIPDLLVEVAQNYEAYQAAIAIPSITQIADKYLQVMGLIPRMD
jgi:glycosyltransferase involved in cell wall biosynthesis